MGVLCVYIHVASVQRHCACVHARARSCACVCVRVSALLRLTVDPPKPYARPIRLFVFAFAFLPAATQNLHIAKFHGPARIEPGSQPSHPASP